MKPEVQRENIVSALRKILLSSLLVTVTTLAISTLASGQMLSPPLCPAAPAADSIESPKELHSHNGQLKVNLSLRNDVGPSGHMQYCYVDERGERSPTLRVRPGDVMILKLKNELSLPSAAHSRGERRSSCSSPAMTADITNLHFHGLSIPPSCHADDSLRTSIPPSHKAFEYRFRIPRSQPAGLYWYHPHVHGNSEEQVLGGASGAIIVEGIERINPLVAGLPERVFIIRDQRLESSTGAVPAHDPSRPAKDLSINFTPVLYPEYSVGTINTAPLRREFWRVLNASADTYVNLAVLFNGEWQKSGLVATHGSWQSLGLVSVDGVAISEANSSARKILWQTEIPIPPGGRAEFIFQTPPVGIKAELFTAGAITTPPEDEDAISPAVKDPVTLDYDDNTPPRPLARIASSNVTVEPAALNESPPSAKSSRVAALAIVPPIRERKLYFSEKVTDPRHPETSTVFFITEEGRAPKAFDPSALDPDIVVHLGDVEDWTIENRSGESHDFHIHQLHFLILDHDEAPVAESYLADTVDVPYWDGISAEFPSVKLRMDFRDPGTVGTFPYHCHILQHADGGMMGLIRVLPNKSKLSNTPTRKREAH